MTILKFEFSHWWFLLLIDIEILFEAIWGFDSTQPRLDSHELITCLHFFFFKWVVVILLVLVVIFVDVLRQVPDDVCMLKAVVGGVAAVARCLVLRDEPRRAECRRVEAAL